MANDEIKQLLVSPGGVFVWGNMVCFFRRDEDVAVEDGIIIGETPHGVEFWPILDDGQISDERSFISWSAFDVARVTGDWHDVQALLKQGNNSRWK